MAAAILPLVAGLAPSIVDLIASLVHRAAPVAEQQLGSGTGPVKFAKVLEDVLVNLQKAAAAGRIDKALPPDSTIALIIQSVVSSMKLSGQLDLTPLPPTAAAQQDLILRSGQSLRITVA